MIRPAVFGAALGLLGLFSAVPAVAGFAAGARAYDGGDYAATYTEWHALAEAGDAMAQTAIAGMHRFGEGRQVDLAAAVQWHRRAARQNDVVAQMNLGEMYRRGLGVGRDRKRAWLWFTIAAELGGKWAGDQLAPLERAMSADEIAHAKRMLETRRLEKTKINQ